jgi:hypothetical protein
MGVKRSAVLLVGYLAGPHSRLLPETRNRAFELVAGVGCKGLWLSAAGWSDWLPICFRDPIVEMSVAKSRLRSLIPEASRPILNE